MGEATTLGGTGRVLLLGKLREAGLPGAVLVVLCLLTSTLPAVAALATGAAVNRLSSGAEGDVLTRVWPVLALGGALLATQVAQLLLGPVEYVVRRRIDGEQRSAVAHLAAARSGIGHLEDVAVQDDLALASANPNPRSWVERTPAEAAVGQLWLVVRFIGALSAAAVVARHSWWLVLFLLAAAAVTQMLLRQQSLAIADVSAAGVPFARRAEYWRGVLVDPGGGRETRVFGLAGWIVDRWRGFTLAHLDPVARVGNAIWRKQWMVFAVLGVAAGGGLYALGSAGAHGTLPIDGMAAAIVALVSLLSLGGLGDASLAIAGGTPGIRALERLRAALSQPAPGGVRPVASRNGHGRPEEPPLIRFENVRFTYPGSARPVLDGLDLEIRPGEVLAIVGENGAGKTTFTKLLARLYEPDEGRITAGGVDVATMDPAEWRRHLAIVFQDFIRYQLSARDNVVLGAPDRLGDQALVERVARDAGLDRLITRLPAQWDTLLSTSRSDGVNLSGGQWQHVALARASFAVRAGAGVLVMDEPTAHLDIRSEVEVFNRLLDGVRGTSVVLISHRLSTVRRADRIVLLEGGRVVESGTHDELLVAGGRYAEMFNSQLTGDGADDVSGEDPDLEDAR